MRFQNRQAESASCWVCEAWQRGPEVSWCMLKWCLSVLLHVKMVPLEVFGWLNLQSVRQCAERRKIVTISSSCFIKEHSFRCQLQVFESHR